MDDLKWVCAVYAKCQMPRRLELPDFHGAVAGAEIDWPTGDQTTQPLQIFSFHATEVDTSRPFTLPWT